eukprot:CAMPEP_0197001358 /NCGR_PEP_ID=MMETSP1380-20130617/6072_1 /TAXON_ID=5936 /ORGANISM="Euplotes crassus, Strain CT5" /LENGTH=338 /DNA_ID=CAMNT_0042418989 /DNA_START=15 /DNA_END=1031 /DNA_ORIENTATION=-
MESTLKLDHVDPKQEIILENKSLDFSFCDMTDITDLKKKEPRAGKRKPIQDSDNEEEENNKTAQLNKQLLAQENAKVEDGKRADDGANEGEGEKLKTKKVANQYAPAVFSVMKQSHIPLINNDRNGPRMGNMDLTQIGATAKQGEEAKKEGAKKKTIKRLCRTLLLNNNEIRSLEGIFPTLEIVMNYPERLKWLDLSFNYLTKIHSDILNFPELKTLYLHGNYIYQLKEVKKLANLSQVISLTLHGNPIEQIPGYRLYIIGIMFSKYTTLKKLDSVIITNKEDEQAYVWNEKLHGKVKKFPEFADDKYKKPPQKEEDAKTGDKKNEDFKSNMMQNTQD